MFHQEAWGKLRSLTTDISLNLTGGNDDLLFKIHQAVYERNSSTKSLFNCIEHQEALCKHVFYVKHTAINIVNFIKTRGLNLNLYIAVGGH